MLLDIKESFCGGLDIRHCLQYLTPKISWSVSWYWIPAGLGFAFRFGLLKYKIWSTEMRVKAILRDIGIIFGLTILWSGLNSYELDSNAVVMVFILTFVYIAYGLAESCEDTGGSTESILLI